MPVHSPATIFGTNIFFCSGLPCTISAAVAPMVRPPYIENAMLAEHLEFVDGLAQRHRQALPAIFRRRRQTEPAAFGDLLEGFLEAFRRGHAAVVMAGAALEIADAIERLQHFFGELGGLAQDRLAHVGGGVAEAGKIVVAVDLKHVVEQEIDVFDGGFVDRHGVLPAGWRLL